MALGRRHIHIDRARDIGLMSLAGTLILVSGAVSAQHEPSLFDAGGQNKAGLVFSPDGKQAFWTEWDGHWGGDGTQRVIYMSELENRTWSKPVPAPFTGQYSDDDPFVSHDGWLYFVSVRPAKDSDEEREGDIWRYSLVEENRLERLSINSDAAEYSPVITASGALYFASARDGGFGQGDIYRAAPSADGFADPEILGPEINSPTGEWNVWVSGDEVEMIFEASSRPTNVSVPGDLYYSSRRGPGLWAKAVPIRTLNTANSDLLPRVGPDGSTLYYTTAPIGSHARIVTATSREVRDGITDEQEPEPGEPE